MKIELDGVSYHISEETLNNLADQGLEKIEPFFDTLKGPVRLLLEQVALMILQYAEQYLVTKGVKPEHAKTIRVKRGENPFIKAFTFFISLGRMAVTYAECSIETHNGEITALTLRTRGKDTSKVGGQLVDTRQKGKWENNLWEAFNSKIA